MPTSPLECLPTELLISITDRLPTGYSVLLLRHVSKTLYHILSSHDVVSHALITHYPHSAEAKYPLLGRTKAVFDAVVRRSYTQSRRRNPKEVSGINCFALFCNEEDQVLAYQTECQRQNGGWNCTLWDIKEDTEATVCVRVTAGGCYNEQGELFRSAVLKDVWCEPGRGVMVVGGRHKHLVATNSGDMEQGPYTEQEVELGYYGIHIAPRLCRHEHTFLHIYSLRRPNLGQLLSSFSFYGITSLTHAACNTKFFSSLSTGSLFIYELQPPPPIRDPDDSPSLERYIFTHSPKSKPPALWRDFVYSTSTTALTVDTLGKYLFIYGDPCVGGFYDRGNGTVVVVSAADGNILKKVILGDSRPLFEYRLQRDDSRLWEWHFESACKPVFRPHPPEMRIKEYSETDSDSDASPTSPISTVAVDTTQAPWVEAGEEVTVTWVGSYGVFGTRGARIGVEGLDSKHRFTGERTPIMIEWRIDTFSSIEVEASGQQAREKVKPTLYFAPSEYRSSGPSSGGAGVMGLPTLTMSYEDITARQELVRWPVTVCSYNLKPVTKQRMLKWGMGRGNYYTTTGGERVLDKSRAITLYFDRAAGAPYEVDFKEATGDGGKMLFPRWKEVLEVGEEVGGGGGQRVDNRFVFEGCGWLLYRMMKTCKDWGKEDGNKKAEEVVIVEYDSDVDMMDGVGWMGKEGGIPVRGDVEGVGERLVLMRF